MQSKQEGARYARFLDISLPFGLVIVLLAVWQAAIALLHIKEFVLPAPTAILRELIVSGPSTILPQLEVTLLEMLAGYAVAICVAAILSVLIIYSSLFRRSVLPLIVASQTIPVITMAPVLVIWFGYNSVPRIIMTAIVAFFPLTVSVVSGLESLDPKLINFFRSLNATPAQIFFKLRLPTALPNIFAGLKVSSTLAIIGATISEWVGSSQGIGYLIAQDTAQLNTARIFASLAVLGLCGMGLFRLIEILERLSMPWVYPRSKPGWWRFFRGRNVADKTPSQPRPQISPRT